MQDTFYIDQHHVLRTHTSPIQIRTMENEVLRLESCPGSVFRCDSDVTHSPNFYQIEAPSSRQKVSMADLKGTISFFVKEFLDRKLLNKISSKLFPFTEPSAEVDCSCPFVKERVVRFVAIQAG